MFKIAVVKKFYFFCKIVWQMLAGLKKIRTFATAIEKQR